VEVYHYCQSDKTYWGLCALLWRSVLLVWTTILAFQTRKSPITFNESKTLAIMIYSQFLFLLCCAVVYYLVVNGDNNINVSLLTRYQSLLYSFDVAAVCCIYFIPKLMTDDAEIIGETRKNSALRSQFHSGPSSSMVPRPSTQSLGDAFDQLEHYVRQSQSPQQLIVSPNHIAQMNDSIVDDNDDTDTNNNSASNFNLAIPDDEKNNAEGMELSE
jgi:7 transmembrane sweet-taste receptor of 3 GCPR